MRPRGRRASLGLAEAARRRRHPADFAEELPDPGRVGVAEVALQQSGELLRPEVGGIGVGDPRLPLDDLARHSERRSFPDRVSVRNEHVEVAARPHRAEELLHEARLAERRRRADDHGRRARLGPRPGQRRGQERELRIAPHERRGSAEERADRCDRAELARERAPGTLSGQGEAPAEELRRREVHSHRERRTAPAVADGFDELLGGAVDRVPGAVLAGGEDTPGRDEDRHPRAQRREREGAAGGARCMLDGRCGVGDRDERRAAGQRIERAPAALHRAAHRFGRLGGGSFREGDVSTRRREAGKDDARDPLLPRGHGGDPVCPGLRRVVGIELEELGEERRAIRRALARVLGEHPVEERLELARHVRAELSYLRRSFEDDLGEDGELVGAGERWMPREAAVEDRAQSVDVGAWVHRITADLLGRHIGRSTDQRAGERQVLVGDRLGDPEVDELERVELAIDEKEICRLEVAVDDAASVRGVERGGGGARDGEDVGHAERAARQAMGEVFPFEPLHGEIKRAAVGCAVRQVANDAGMVDRGEDLRFPDEALCLAPCRGEDLERDVSPGCRVVGAVDVAHSSRGDERMQLEPLPDDSPEERVDTSELSSGLGHCGSLDPSRHAAARRAARERPERTGAPRERAGSGRQGYPRVDGDRSRSGSFL